MTAAALQPPPRGDRPVEVLLRLPADPVLRDGVRRHLGQLAGLEHPTLVVPVEVRAVPSGLRVRVALPAGARPLGRPDGRHGGPGGGRNAALGGRGAGPLGRPGRDEDVLVLLADVALGLATLHAAGLAQGVLDADAVLALPHGGGALVAVRPFLGAVPGEPGGAAGSGEAVWPDGGAPGEPPARWRPGDDVAQLAALCDERLPAGSVPGALAGLLVRAGDPDPDLRPAAGVLAAALGRAARAAAGPGGPAAPAPAPGARRPGGPAAPGPAAAFGGPVPGEAAGEASAVGKPRMPGHGRAERLLPGVGKPRAGGPSAQEPPVGAAPGAAAPPASADPAGYVPRGPGGQDGGAPRVPAAPAPGRVPAAPPSPPVRRSAPIPVARPTRDDPGPGRPRGSRPGAGAGRAGSDAAGAGAGADADAGSVRPARRGSRPEAGGPARWGPGWWGPGWWPSGPVRAAAPPGRRRPVLPRGQGRARVAAPLLVALVAAAGVVGYRLVVGGAPGAAPLAAPAAAAGTPAAASPPGASASTQTGASAAPPAATAGTGTGPAPGTPAAASGPAASGTAGPGAGAPTGPAPGAPAGPADGSPAVAAASGAPAATAAVPAQPWAQVLAGLDATRSGAFAGGGEARLARAVRPGGQAWRADTAALRGLRGQGLRARGLATEVRDVRVVSEAADAVRLLVWDVRSSYALVDPAGRVVRQVAAAAPRRWEVVLVRGADGWLVDRVGPR